MLLVTASSKAECREIMVVLRGRLWAQLQMPDAASPADLRRLLERCWERFLTIGIRELDHDSVDDMHILGSWLARHEGHPAILPLGDRAAAPNWDLLSERALGLRREQLDFDAWRKTRDAGEVDWGESMNDSVIADMAGV
jgi:hypothetical protein